MSPQHMKAWTLSSYGPTSPFAEEHLPVPSPGPKEVLVRVHASSYNPIESKIRTGVVPIGPPLPAILNGDVAGVVVERGPGVESLQEGDRVYGCCGGFFGVQGALAEYICVREDTLAALPLGLSFQEAAVLPIASITAWDALVERANVQQGQRVLILGGTGGVGHIGVQLARSLGAEVVAACGTPEKIQLAKQLGAHHAYNYRELSTADAIARFTEGAGFDVVFDTAGGESLAAGLEAVRMGGHLVTIAARGSHNLTPGHARGATLHMVMMLDAFATGRGHGRYQRILTEVGNAVTQGRIRPVVDPTRFRFDQVSDAHEYAARGAHAGKISLTCPTPQAPSFARS